MLFRSIEIQNWISKLQKYSDRFVLLDKPTDGKYLEWYTDVMNQYALPSYVSIEKPDRYLLQNCYQDDRKNDLYLFVNAHMHEPRKTKLQFPATVTTGKNGWIWDPSTGKKYKLPLKNNSFELELGPAETYLIVFNKERSGREWKPLSRSASNQIEINE